MALYTAVPYLVYYAPGSVWNYIVLPLGKGLLNKIYSYVYSEEERDNTLHQEFITHLQGKGTRIYEVIAPDNRVRNGVLTRYIVLETTRRDTPEPYSSGPVHL